MTRITWTTRLAVLSVLSLAACSKSEEHKANQALNATETGLANAASAAGNAVDNLSMAATPTPSGQEFADKAAKSDAFEIAAARLAATHAASAEVKSFARMMIEAHTGSTTKVKAAAASASPVIVPNATLTRDQEDALAKLRGLNGADFDKAYVNGQVDAHEEALDLMKKYAADGTVPSLKTAAGEIAPVVEKHLASARALDKD